MRNRVRSTVLVPRLALALLALAICSGAALVGSSWLLGNADAASDQGPVAAYSFDAGEGATVEDLTGNEHTATIEGADWTTAGRFGGAMQFNGGEEDCLTIANSPDLSLNEEFTLEAWVRPEGPDYTAPVFFKEAEGGAAYAISFGFAEYTRPEGTISPEPSEEVTVEGSEDVPQYTWSHLALSFDGARMRLYVNGELVDTAETSGPISSEAPLEIGCSGNPKEAFTGRIDEARVYDRALSQTEVQTDEATGLQTPQRGPVAAYSFDAGEGEVLGDLTGNGHDGTIEGADWTKGKYGSALKFDSAEEDCVAIPDAAELRLTEDLTIEAWVKPEGGGHSKPAIFKEGAGESFAYGLFAGLEGEGTLVAPGGRSDLEDPTLLDQNAWSHLALTYNGTYLRLYVNGAEVDSAKTAGAIWTNGELRIGCGENVEEFFTGKIDEARIYDRALDQGEVAADSGVPLQTPRTGPVAAYSFDEGTGETVADLTGNEHTGTIEEGEWAKGRFGGAIEFDGSGKICVSVADAPDLRLSEEFTLEAWVRAEGGVYGDPVVVRDSEGETAFGLGVGSSEEGFAEGFIGEGKEQSTAVGTEDEVREYAWTHIAATYDGAKLRIYVDGELAGTEAAPTPPATGSGALRIGCDAPNGQFTGRIDEVRVYDRALSETEVQGDKAVPLQTPQQGPVAAYSFDEGEGETGADLTGAGHTATIEGAHWTTHGRYGGALEFDASEEDLLRVADSPDLDFSDEFTLEAWVRPSGAENTDAPLIDKQREGGLGYYLYEGGSVSDRPIGAASEEQEPVAATEALPAHAWSHLSLVFDGDRSRLYVNGALVANQAAKPIVSAAGDLEIGGSTETTDYFDGRIDEVRLYNRALSQTEVQADKATPLQTPLRGPVAAYSLDEGEGETVEDLTGNGHTATIHGASWATKGRYGGAMEFDAAEESYLSIPASEDLDGDEELTVEAWVRPTAAPSGFGEIAMKEREGNPEYTWTLDLHETEPAGYFMRTEEGSVAGGEGTTPLNTWTHVAMTDDGAHNRLYVNGELVDTEPAIPFDGHGEIRIGGNGHYPQWFDGRIDEVRIYDRALDEGEIREGMAAGFPVAITEPATEVEANSAILNATVTMRGGDTEYFFEYGPTEAYGNVIEGEELGSESQKVTLREAAIDLAPESAHHYRVVAVSPAGVARGKDQTFTTSSRTMSEAEEKELKEADERSEPIASESASGPGNFYGMMWTGNIAKMLENHPGTKENTFDAIKHSGAKILRLEVSPENEAAVENAFTAAAERNITILPEFGGGAFPKEGPKRVDWVNYAKKLVNKYGPDSSFKPPVENWEIWNEPNMPFPSTPTAEGKPNPKAFAKFFGEMSTALDNASKKPINILTPGLFGYRSSGCHPACHILPAVFLEEMDKQLTNLSYTNAYDAISIHPYVFRVGKPKHQHRPEGKDDVAPVARAIRRIVQGIRNLKLSKGKSIWVTELGFPVDNPGNKGKVPPVSPSMQNMLLAQSLSVLQNHRQSMGIAHTFYYNIQDDDARPGWEYRSGLLRGNGTPRPAWTAYKNHAGGEKCPFSTPC